MTIRTRKFPVALRRLVIGLVVWTPVCFLEARLFRGWVLAVAAIPSCLLIAAWRDRNFGSPW